MARRLFLVTFSHVRHRCLGATARWDVQLTSNKKNTQSSVFCHLSAHPWQCVTAHTQPYLFNARCRQDGCKLYCRLCLCHAYIRTEQMEPRAPLPPTPHPLRSFAVTAGAHTTVFHHSHKTQPRRHWFILMHHWPASRVQLAAPS